MADTMAKHARSALMRRIRGDSLKPETALLESLSKLPLGPVIRNDRSLPGSPDFALPLSKTAVFVHGCFWHCCPRHFKLPKSGRAGWKEKFERNVRRDARARRRLNRLGWSVLVVWEHDLKHGGDAAASRVLRAARKSAVDKAGTARHNAAVKIKITKKGKST